MQTEADTLEGKMIRNKKMNEKEQIETRIERYQLKFVMRSNGRNEAEEWKTRI